MKICLDLRILDPTIDNGHSAVQAEVRVRNCGTGYAVVPPRIFPQASGEMPEPWGVLTFSIEPLDGHSVPYSGEWLGNKLKLPEPNEFLVLGPGYFYGLRISLTDGPFAYAMKRPGKYRIKAVFRTAAREWLESRSEPLPFDLPRVFSGTVSSETIAVTLK